MRAGTLIPTGTTCLPPVRNGAMIYPLDAPGLSRPGPDLIAMANALGDVESQIIPGKKKNDATVTIGAMVPELVRRLLYSSGTMTFVTSINHHKRVPLRVVSGHIWGSPAPGPQPAEVMVLGKMLGREEVDKKKVMIGKSGQLLYDLLCRFIDRKQVDTWYVTNLLKTGHPEGYDGTKLRATWIADWMLILDQELRLVRPKYILCLGADAAKALFGKSATIDKMSGRVLEYEYSLKCKPDDPGDPHKALVMVITHPAAVLGEPRLEHQLRTDIEAFASLVTGRSYWNAPEPGLDHRYIFTFDAAMAVCDEAERDITDNLLAIDAEWHGQHPQNAGWYMRSFQISWKLKTAAFIAIRGPGGVPLYSAEQEHALKRRLRRLCEGKLLTGHFIEADLENTTAWGLELRDLFRVPKSWQEYRSRCYQGLPCGFDSGRAAHALRETDDFSLTAQMRQHAPEVPRYDVELKAWLERYCKERGLKKEELEGFGDCPDDILPPYGAYDADSARRVTTSHLKKLDSDEHNNCCWEPFWIAMRALPAVLEINCTGLLIDKERLDSLTVKYLTKRNQLTFGLRTWARWDEFNPNSHPQVRELLFGEQLNRVTPDPTQPNKVIRLRPEKANSLYLTPILDTGKRPTAWNELVADGVEHEHTPSTKLGILPMLALQAKQVRRRHNDGEIKTFDLSGPVEMLRHYRIISQILKSSLRPPQVIVDEITKQEEYEEDEDGFLYSAGLANSICDDGRVRTHMYPTKETGRWSSARPPLHNLSKKRESDYARIMGDDYDHPLRSMLMADPGGLLVEADYVGAELFGAAVQCGDPLMLEHVLRSQLPEDHPNYYDIHSNVAVLAFQLKCSPTKGGLESIDKIDLRVVAKNVMFGIMYGRGAKAIALEAQQQGVMISVEEAQNIIDTIFELYPGLKPYFEECRSRAIEERWLATCFGRFRRFPKLRDRSKQGDFEREAMNMPIQGLVADAVNRAVDYLTVCREERWWDVQFDIRLQMHDALMFWVPFQYVPRFTQEVLPYCMSRCVPIYPHRLDGTPIRDPRAPYYLGVDIEIAHHWGQFMLPNEYMERGLSPSVGKWHEHEGGWRHESKKQGKFWRDGNWLPVTKT